MIDGSGCLRQDAWRGYELYKKDGGLGVDPNIEHFKQLLGVCF